MGRIWSDENVQLLIRTIREYEQIWNTKHPLYTLNKRARHDLWKEIADLFKKFTQLEFKPVELCSKWNCLRLTFQKETQKALNSGLKGSRWKHYDMLTFLMDHPIKKHGILKPSSKQYSLRKRTDLKRETLDENEVISVGSISPVEFQKRIESCSAGVNNTTVQSRPGSESTFGDYVAAEMRRLDLDLQMRAKKIIFDVLIELQYEQERRSRGTHM